MSNIKHDDIVTIVGENSIHRDDLVTVCVDDWMTIGVYIDQLVDQNKKLVEMLEGEVMGELQVCLEILDYDDTYCLMRNIKNLLAEIKG